MSQHIIYQLWKHLVIERGVEPSEWAFNVFLRFCSKRCSLSQQFVKDTFYEQTLIINANRRCHRHLSLLRYLRNSVRVILQIEDEDITSLKYKRFIAVFANHGDRYDVTQICQFAVDVLMNHKEHESASLIMDELIGICFECKRNEFIWNRTNDICASYWRTSDHSQFDSKNVSQITLQIEMLSNQQILFLFHPSSFLWNHPKIEIAKMFKFKLEADRGDILGDIHRNYALNIHHLRGRKGVMSLLMLIGNRTRIPRISRNRYRGRLTMMQ